MAKQTKPRADKYEEKIKLKEGVEFVDLINASLKITAKKVAPKKKKG